MPVAVKKQQKRNYDKRQRYAKGKHCKNFYVLDTETSGFEKDGSENEPIQIVVLLYKNGKEVKRFRYNKFFFPTGDITDSALETHGMDEERLRAN